jgi:hypothetical protein
MAPAAVKHPLVRCSGADTSSVQNGLAHGGIAKPPWPPGSGTLSPAPGQHASQM